MAERGRVRETKKLLRDRGCPLPNNAPALSYAEWALAHPEVIGRTVLVDNIEAKPFLAALLPVLRG